MTDGLIPTLDGERVLLASEDESGRCRYVYADGAPVDVARAADIVFTRPFSSSSSDADPAPHWWAALEVAPSASLLFADEAHDDDADVDAEVASWLMKVGESQRTSPDVELDAAFFHSSLQAWLGEGHAPRDEVRWDYSFWKAELVPVSSEESSTAIPAGATVFEARVWRGADSPPEAIRYFVTEPGAESRERAGEPLAVENASSEQRRAGWLTPPPDLIADENEVATGDVAVVVDDVDALFGDG